MLIVEKMKAYIPRHWSNTKLMRWLKRLTWKVPKKRIAKNKEANMRVFAAAENNPESFYRRNQYIENQRQWGDIKFGISTMKFSGCEIIAAYNALLSLGREMTEKEMAELISTFERRGAVLWGYWGTLPTAIWNYFKDKGYDAAMTDSLEEKVINAMGEECDTIVVTVYNDADNIMEQIHTVNVSKDEEGKFFRHNSPAGPYDSLWEAIEGMSQGHAKPISVIGIIINK